MKEPTKATNPRIIKKDVLDARAQADEIVAAAREEAQRIQQEAEAERRKRVDSGYEEGYQKATDELAETLLAFAEAQEGARREAESEMVALAVRIAERIVGEELKQHPDSLAALVRQALANVPRARELTVQLHPSALQAAEVQLQKIQQLAGRREIDFVANPELAEADCVVECELGVVNARLEPQLRSIESRLAARRSGEDD